MNNDLKNFIEDYIDYVDQYRFQDIYEAADIDRLLTGYTLCELTEVFLAAGIDPMPYLTAVPEEYLAMSPLVEGTVVIPKNISAINQFAFNCCVRLTDVVIEDGCMSINGCAFAQCGNLRSCTIPQSVEYISADAFDDPHETFVIKCYKGSVAETYAKKHNIRMELL